MGAVNWSGESGKYFPARFSPDKRNRAAFGLAGQALPTSSAHPQLYYRAQEHTRQKKVLLDPGTGKPIAGRGRTLAWQ